MSAALILSGLWGLQPDPEAAPSGGPRPQCGVNPVASAAPSASPRASTAALGAAESGRRPRGKGHDGAPGDRRCGAQGGATPAAGLSVLAERGARRLPRGRGVPQEVPTQARAGVSVGFVVQAGPPPRHLLGNLWWGALGAAAQMEKLRPETGGAS